MQPYGRLKCNYSAFTCTTVKSILTRLALGAVVVSSCYFTLLWYLASCQLKPNVTLTVILLTLAMTKLRADITMSIHRGKYYGVQVAV